MENVKLTFRDEKNRRLGKRKRIRKKKKEIWNSCRINKFNLDIIDNFYYLEIAVNKKEIEILNNYFFNF